MMATVSHVTFGLGLRKFQADGFLLTRVYMNKCNNTTGNQAEIDVIFKIQYLNFKNWCTKTTSLLVHSENKQTGTVLFVQRNIEQRSCNRYCSGKSRKYYIF